MVSASLKYVRLANANVLLGLQIALPEILPVAVLPMMMDIVQQISVDLGLDESKGEDINLEWLIVNTDYNQYGQGMNVRVQVCADRPLESVYQYIKRLVTEYLDQSFVEQHKISYQFIEIEDKSLLCYLPSSDMVFICKNAYSNGMAKNSRIRAPRDFFPYLQESLVLPIEKIKEQIRRTRNAGISFRFQPAVFSVAENKNIQAGAKYSDATDEYRTAYGHYAGMQKPFLFCGMLWGNCSDAIVGLLCGAGLKLEKYALNKQSLKENDGAIKYEMLFDPWILQQRLYGVGETKRLKWMTDVQEVAKACGTVNACEDTSITEHRNEEGAKNAWRSVIQPVLPDTVISQIRSILPGIMEPIVKNSIEISNQGIISRLDSGEERINKSVQSVKKEVEEVNEQITNILGGTLSEIRKGLEKNAEDIDEYKKLETLVSDLKRVYPLFTWTDEDWKDYGIDYELQGMKDEEKARLQNSLMVLKHYKILRAKPGNEETMKRQLINYAAPLLCQYEVLAKRILRDIYEAVLKKKGISLTAPGIAGNSETDRNVFCLDDQNFSFFTRYATNSNDPLHGHYNNRGLAYAELLNPASEKGIVDRTCIGIWLNIYSSLREIRNKVHGAITEDEFQRFCNVWLCRDAKEDKVACLSVMIEGLKKQQKDTGNDKSKTIETVKNQQKRIISDSHFDQSALQFLLSCRMRLKEIKENQENKDRAQQAASV